MTSNVVDVDFRRSHIGLHWVQKLTIKQSLFREYKRHPAAEGTKYSRLWSYAAHFGIQLGIVVGPSIVQNDRMRKMFVNLMSTKIESR